jgi:hypothetical protein
LLLYWSLMQDTVDDLIIRHDDGFRHPEGDPDKPWVSWQRAHSATVSYLHGALHLFDAGAEIIKYTWSKTDKPIVEQIRTALAEEKYPIFVAEGESTKKEERILHNGYLQKALRSFEGCCNSASNAIVVFGHSLAATDRHILQCIAKGRCADLAVSLFGDPESEANRSIISNALALQAERGRAKGSKPNLRLTFFDAASAHVWG